MQKLEYLSEYIYIEEFRSLLDCVAELGSVRKRDFGVLDFTNEIFPELNSIAELKPFLVNIPYVLAMALILIVFPCIILPR